MSYSWKKNLLKCIIANKNDLIEERQISEEDGEKLADEIGAYYYETSAKNNVEIYDIFSKIVKIYSESYEEIQVNLKYLKEEKEEKRKDRCCSGIRSDSFDFDFSGILYHLKLTNSNTEKNDIIEDNENNKEKEKEIIEYINGDTKEILNGNSKESILNFNDGDIFEGEISEDNKFITGKLNIENLEINIYNKKIVNLINVLFLLIIQKF